jgi:bis(5'-nucleosidyl)-tetraphosphatase
MIRDEAFGIIPLFEVAGADRRYLLIRHRQGHWSFPKGHRDPGETDIEAAYREFQEETGIPSCVVQSDPRFQEQYGFDRPDGQRVEKQVTYYLGRLQGTGPDASEPPPTQVQVSEVSEARWCTAIEAAGLITFPAAQGVLRDCESYLSYP